MRAIHFNEPELEFGNGRHIDIRFGLTHFMSLDSASELAPRCVRLGVVGDQKSIEDFSKWVGRCRLGIPGKETQLTTLFPEFPGFGLGKPYCDIVCSEQLTRSISASTFDELNAIESRDEFVTRSAGHYYDQLQDLLANTVADVGVCLMSPEILKRIDTGITEQQGPRSLRRGMQRDRPKVWHDYLKALCLPLRCPIQIVRPATYGGKVHKYRRDGTASSSIEDEATRAWNFFTAIYYKAKGVPWRMIRKASEFDTCFIGVSFYHGMDEDVVQTSIAQVFNERGEGVVVRGGPAEIRKEDRTPHLSEANSATLIGDALRVYKREHGHMPARVVCHKSSYFSPQEITGAKQAAASNSVDNFDLLSLRKSSTRFFRRKTYPPLRGTAIYLDDSNALLYTQGSVDFYRSYPGMHVPRPMHVLLDSTMRNSDNLLVEVLSLTKMNWNSTRFINAEPITLAASRNVAEVLRYRTSDQPIAARYSHYM